MKTARDVKETKLKILKKVLTLPDNTFTPIILAKQLRLSRPLMSYHLKGLVAIGLVKKINETYPHMYKATKKATSLDVKDFSYSTRKFNSKEKIGSHDIYITIPIGDKSVANLPKGFWKKINLKLKNNIQKHTSISIGDHVVALRETTKNIIVQMSDLELKSFREVHSVFNKIVYDLFNILKNYNYWIDPREAYCSDPEFTHWTPEDGKDSKVNNKRIKLMLGHQRAKVLIKDKAEEAWTKFDNTPDQGNFETNDWKIAEARLMMPINIQNMLKLQQQQTEIMNQFGEGMQTFSKEIKLHLETYSDMKEAIGLFKQAISGMKGKHNSHPSCVLKSNQRSLKGYIWK